MRGKSREGRVFPLLGLRRGRQAGIAVRVMEGDPRSVVIRAVVISRNNGGHRVVATGTQRMATGKAPGSEPCSTERPVADDRFAGVIRARRKKPARPGEIWRDQQLVAVDRREHQPDDEVAQRAVDGRARVTALTG
jgi:hypothetical protein